jgi:hypothetical protein
MDSHDLDYLEKIKQQIHKAKQMASSKSKLIEPYSIKQKFLESKNTNCLSFCNKDIPEREFQEQEESSSTCSENSCSNVQSFLE